jgi:hypothetical protein
VASKRLRQYDALGHHKCVPCSDEYAPKPFGVHSNELVDDKYCYDWSITWWTCRKTGQPVTEAVMLEIERLIARSGDLNYEGLEDMNILFVSGHWMFIDSNSMVIQHRMPDIVDTMEPCNADVHYDPSPSREGKPSTTLPYKGTEGCCGEVVVEKHAPQHMISKMCCEQCKAQTECAYIDLTPKQGDKPTA